jgi:hypothetical protein
VNDRALHLNGAAPIDNFALVTNEELERGVGVNNHQDTEGQQ